MRTILFLFFSIISLSACEDALNTTVNIDPPEYDPQLVTHLRMDERDSAVRIVLTRSFGVLDNVSDERKWYVSGASVEWWSEGQKVMDVPRLSADSAWVYTAALPQPLQSGKTYEVRVSHPDFPSIRAMQVMPTAPAVSDLKLRRNVSTVEGERQQIEFNLNDPAGVENFYEISAQTRYYFVSTTFDPNGNIIKYDTFGYSDNTIYFEEAVGQDLPRGVGETLLVSDKLFDGQKYPIHLRFPPYYSGDPSDSTPYTLRVRSISKEEFQWSRSYYERYDNEFNIFAEPVNVFTNFDSGLGIFGLGAGSVYRVQ
jgi:Domain of unknown function (DUF4249)